MESFKFEWDENKNRINLKKHHISFYKAKSVFYDEDAILFDDPDHSTINENRFLIIGFSEKARCLIVSHCLRKSGKIIRLISARKATRYEMKLYAELRGGNYER